MNARVSQINLTFVMPTAFSRVSDSTAAMPKQRRGVAARLAALVKRMVEAPRRRAALNELSALSDYELSDIGLSRSDLPRVFDSTFVQERRAA